MPGGKANSALLSYTGRELEPDIKRHLVSSNAQRKDDVVKQIPKMTDGGPSLHWGQRKRPRLTKGTADTTASISHTTTIEAGFAERTQCESTRWQPASQSRSSASQLFTSPGTESAVELANRTTEHPIPLSEERNGCAETCALSCDSGKRSPSDKRSDKLSDISNGSTSSKCHRRKEHDALNEKATTDRNGTLEPFRWPKFLISLSWKEKEDDFMAIKGAKLPQRPRRHSKKVERILQYACPGTFLCEVNQDRYEVREKKNSKRRQRGLKDMDDVESDSG